ncbi:hypothetical protein L9F63_015133, partial [Diploptera punctata]
ESIHAIIIVEIRKLPDEAYAEKRNLIESTKEFNWKNRKIGVILRDADVVVY